MAGKVTRSVEDRFWEKVIKTERCWLWVGNRNKKGYGRFWLDGRNHFAQRVSWRLHHGPFNDELRVLHRCDRPSCVHPDHLFLGTDADNQTDKVAKGRSAAGEKNGNRKLTVAQVKAIRASAAPTKALAKRYRIDVTQVYNILARKQWRHV
jgi:hypothetical protein